MKPRVRDAHIYFPATVHTDLKKMAAANRRSISAEIVLAVENKLREWKTEGQFNGNKR